MGIRLLDEPGRVSFLGLTFRSLKSSSYQVVVEFTHPNVDDKLVICLA